MTDSAGSAIFSCKRGPESEWHCRFEGNIRFQKNQNTWLFSEDLLKNDARTCINGIYHPEFSTMSLQCLEYLFMWFIVSSLCKDQIDSSRNTLLHIVNITCILQVKPEEYFRQDVLSKKAMCFSKFWKWGWLTSILYSVSELDTPRQSHLLTMPFFLAPNFYASITH